MYIKEISSQDHTQFDHLALHPLQSWAWGDFRLQSGVKVLRLGQFSHQDKLIKTYQITLHPIPHTHFTIAYIPKSDMPSHQLLHYLKKIAKKNNTIFFKFEPNIYQPAGDPQKDILKKTRQNLIKLGLKPGKPLFTPYSFILDLTQPEAELLKQMKSKTRYNTRLAEKKGVKISKNNSSEAFSDYLNLTFNETTVRQGFYAHNQDYHRQMWRTLHSAGIAHLFTASYHDQTLVTWIVFIFNNTLYYPYGASSSSNRELMPSNLMMWEVIKFGQKMGCTKFDMWGSLGPNPDPTDSWLGFHRFKQGYNPTLMEFVGSYDLVINPVLYKFYRLADQARWLILGLKNRFGK